MNNVRIIVFVCIGVLGAMLPQAKADAVEPKNHLYVQWTCGDPRPGPDCGHVRFQAHGLNGRTAISFRFSTRTKITCTAHSWRSRTTV